MQYEPWPKKPIPAGPVGPVTEAQIDKILQTMGAELDRERKSALRREINTLWQTVSAYDKRQDAALPHKQVEGMKRVQTLARELREALCETSHGCVRYDAGFCIISTSGNPEQWQQLRDAVVEAAKIEKWAAAACAELRRSVGRQGRLGEGRLYFVCSLADLYATAFEQPATSTKGGLWEIFLGEVLAVLPRGKRLTEPRVHALWLNAKKYYLLMTAFFPSDRSPINAPLARVRFRHGK
jgi:hypothetical protein